MIVPSNSPLPTNSMSPWPGRSPYMTDRLTEFGRAIYRAKAANACAASPSTFLSLGNNIVTDVALTQAQVTASQGSLQSAKLAPTVASVSVGNPAIANAPVISSRSSGSSSGGQSPNTCSAAPVTRTVAPPKISLPVMLPAVQAPPVAPINQPAVSGPPKWKNLCWALRNGWVNQSQFDPAEYLALDFRCSQLGYTGACPPSGDVAAYLNAGNLPHISVSQSDLDSLTPSPDMSGVTCPQSDVMGMAGYAPAWGNAFGGSCSANVAVGAGSSGGSFLFWAGIAAASFGLYKLYTKGA